MQKILIVEDDIDIQDILKNHLIDAGYKVAVASDGVAGIAMFDDTIDLVLLDIMLPKIDGYTLRLQSCFARLACRLAVYAVAGTRWP